MVVKTLAMVTIKQALRDKIIFGVVVFAVIIFLVASLFGSVSIGDTVRVIKDFGLFSISLMSVLYTVVAGASLLHAELSRKTIYNIMSKPIRRWQFILGKFFGLVVVSITLTFLMALFLSCYLWLWEGVIDWSLLVAYLYIAIESVLISALVIFFSSIVITPFLNGLFVVAVFLAGRCSDYLVEMTKLSGNPIPEKLYYLVPHLHLVWIGDDVVLGKLPSFYHFLCTVSYVGAYSSVLLILAIFAFDRREFN